MEASYDPSRKDWSIITISKKGTVSLIRELTLAEARRVYERLDNFYGVYEPDDGWMESSQDDIKHRFVMGPEGWNEHDVETWDVWPKQQKELA